MKKIFTQVLLSFILFISLQAQEGALLLSHFKESRDIEDQSWAICQDQNNVMMFANRRGIMTFDGVKWDFIRMPAVPYSIRNDRQTGKVFAGCENNYGYLDKDEKGFFRYVSISGDSAETGLVTNIFFTDSTVYFYSESSISRHNILTGEFERKFEPGDGLSFTGMIFTPKNIFINVLSKGLFRIEADTLFPIVTGYLLKNEVVLFSLPYDDKNVLLGLGSGSLSLFDGIKFYDYKVSDEGYIRQNILSDGISISDSIYAFSTLDGGAVVVDRKRKKVLATVNYERGLPDDEIFAMESDNKGGLWLSHQFGLTRADLRIPIGNFSIYPGLKGNILNATLHENQLFVATSEGVYYLTEVKNYSEVMVRVKRDDIPSVLNTRSLGGTQGIQGSPGLQKQEAPKSKKGILSRIFGKKETTGPTVKTETKTQLPVEKASPSLSKPIESHYVNKSISRLKSVNYIYRKVRGLDDKCKQLVSTPSGILVSTNKGLYVITNHIAKVVVEDRYINFIGNRTDDNRYYIAANDGYFYITPKSGRWSIVYPDKTFSQTIYSISRGNDNFLWAGGTSVVYKIPDKTGVASSDYKVYSVENSYPEKCIVENFNDTIFLVAESGTYFLDQNSDSLVRYSSGDYQSGSGTVYIYSQADILWYRDTDKWRFFTNELNSNENKAVLLNIFEDIAAISVTPKYVWVITGDNRLYRYSREIDFSITPDTEIFVKSVTNQDGIFFGVSDIKFKRGDNTVYFDLVAPGYLKQNSVQYQYKLDEIMTDWSKWSNSSTITLMPPPGEHTLAVRAKDIWGNISEPKTLNFTIKAPFTRTTGFYAIILLTVLIIIILIARFRVRQLKKEKMILEEKVIERTREIQAQKEEITSSIEYASRIQMAMLPAEVLYKSNFSDHFIIFKPRDIVSGDFYWIGENEKSIFFTVADCTGHGVPGAFLSSLGISTLNEIITNKMDLHANNVLNLLREKIKKSLHQTGKEGEAADGMDIAFCILNKNRKKLEFAGAYNTLLLFQNGVLREYKGDRMPIGIYYGEKESFTNYEISVKKGDSIYIFSDGLCDQFGGNAGTKYKIASLKKLLIEINMKSMTEQSQIIEQVFNQWKGMLSQVDDITVIGVRI